MNNYAALTALMERVIHRYTQWEDRKRTYGTEIPLSKAEIHAIAAVGDSPGLVFAQLAADIGATLVTLGMGCAVVFP